MSVPRVPVRRRLLAGAAPVGHRGQRRGRRHARAGAAAAGAGAAGGGAGTVRADPVRQLLTKRAGHALRRRAQQLDAWPARLRCPRSTVLRESTIDSLELGLARSSASSSPFSSIRLLRRAHFVHYKLLLAWRSREIAHRFAFCMK